jgi:hypothetical protein
MACVSLMGLMHTYTFILDYSAVQCTVLHCKMLLYTMLRPTLKYCTVMHCTVMSLNSLPLRCMYQLLPQ